jgi:hypothetical protein
LIMNKLPRADHNGCICGIDRNGYECRTVKRHGYHDRNRWISPPDRKPSFF